MDSQMPWSRQANVNSQIHSSQLSHPSQSVDSTRLPRSGSERDTAEKACWDLRATEEFIKICVEEVHAGNRPGSHFNRTGWENIKRKFYEATNRNYSRLQFKNRWDNLKKDWSLWVRLLRGSTGLGWDHTKQTVIASNEWWNERLKGLGEAAKFKERGPIMVDEQTILFSDVVATGENAWTPSSGLLPPHLEDEPDDTIFGHVTNVNESDVHINIGMDDILQSNVVGGTSRSERDPSQRENHLSQENNGPSQRDNHPNRENNGPSRRGVRQSTEFPTRIGHKKQKKMSNADKIVKCLERMVQSIEKDSASISPTTHMSQNYSIKECLEILNGMDGIERGGSLWMYATRLFLKPAVRELFVSIQEDEFRLKWLEEQMERDVYRRSSSTTSVQQQGDSRYADQASSG